MANGYGINPSDRLLEDMLPSNTGGLGPESRATIGPNTGRNAEPFNINTASFPALLKEILTSPQGSMFPLAGAVGMMKQGLRAPSIIQRATYQANRAMDKVGEGLNQMSRQTAYQRPNLPKAVREMRRSQAHKAKMDRQVREFENTRTKNTKKID